MKPFTISIRSWQTWLVLMLPFVFFACQEDAVVDETSKLPARKPQYDVVENYQPLKSPHFVPIEEAAEIAASADLRDSEKEERLEQRDIASKQVVSVKDQPLYYVFNFEKQGFAIVSADRRAVPLLAYSDESTFVSGEVSDGVIIALQEMQDYILHQRDSLKEPESDVLSMWQELKGSRIDRYKNGRSSANARLIRYSRRGPFLSTRWGQGCGYNELLNGCGSNGSCGRMLTGCVATSMAQIMRYHRSPSWYNWSMPSIRTFNDGVTDLDRLMRDSGVAANMNYGCNSSGTYLDDARDALVNNFGYRSSTDHRNYKLSKVLTEMVARRPVMLAGFTERTCFLWWCGGSGSGHAWVADGYKRREYSSGNVYRYLHMNWGWNGSSNGWYYTKGSYKGYKYEKEMIVNIRP